MTRFSKADMPAGKKRKMTHYRIDEVSGVDNPAQKGAKICIAKADAEVPAGFAKGALVMLDEAEGHTHLIYTQREDCLLPEEGGYTSYERAEGDEYGHSHPWVLVDGKIQVGPALGHNHGVPKIKKSDLPVDSTTPDRVMMDAQRGDQPTTPQEPAAMTTTTAPAAPDTSAELAKRDAEITRLTGIVSLSPSHRTHFEGLAKRDQDAFLAASTADRDAEVSKAEAANPEVYKARDGKVYRKSDDPSLVSMAKRLDAQEETIAKAAEREEVLTFAKRANAEMGNLPGEEAVKAAVLRAVEKGVPVPADMLPKVAEMFKAADATFAKTASRIGHGGGGVTPSETTPDGSYAAGLAKFAKTEKIEDLGAAEVAFLKTAEGKAAYNAAENAKNASAAGN